MGNLLDVVFFFNICLWLMVYTIERLTNYTILLVLEYGNLFKSHGSVATAVAVRLPTKVQFLQRHK